MYEAGKKTKSLWVNSVELVHAAHWGLYAHIRKTWRDVTVLPSVIRDTLVKWIGIYWSSKENSKEKKNIVMKYSGRHDIQEVCLPKSWNCEEKTKLFFSHTIGWDFFIGKISFSTTTTIAMTTIGGSTTSGRNLLLR